MACPYASMRCVTAMTITSVTWSPSSMGRLMRSSIGSVMVVFLAVHASSDCSCPGDSGVVEGYCVEGVGVVAARLAGLDGDGAWTDLEVWHAFHHPSKRSVGLAAAAGP